MLPDEVARNPGLPRLGSANPGLHSAAPVGAEESAPRGRKLALIKCHSCLASFFGIFLFIDRAFEEGSSAAGQLGAVLLQRGAQALAHGIPRGGIVQRLGAAGERLAQGGAEHTAGGGGGRGELPRVRMAEALVHAVLVEIGKGAARAQRAAHDGRPSGPAAGDGGGQPRRGTGDAADDAVDHAVVPRVLQPGGGGLCLPRLPRPGAAFLPPALASCVVSPASEARLRQVLSYHRLPP